MQTPIQVVRVLAYISTIISAAADEGPDEMTSADPEGRGTVGPDPPGKSQVIWVSIGNKQLDPPPWKKLDPPPLENVGPPLEP